MVAVAHLALARSQSIRAGILGTKENSLSGCFLLYMAGCCCSDRRYFFEKEKNTGFIGHCAFACHIYLDDDFFFT